MQTPRHLDIFNITHTNTGHTAVVVQAEGAGSNPYSVELTIRMDLSSIDVLTDDQRWQIFGEHSSYFIR